MPHKFNNTMKKILILGIAVVGLTLTSCKKERTCECTITTTIDGNSTSQTVTSTTEATKKDAKEACENGNSSQELLGIKTEAVCELK